MSHKHIIIAGVATHTNSFSDEWEQSLQNGNYPYKILCKGQKWTDFTVKMKGWLDFLKNLDDNNIIAFVDVYDILFVRSFDEFSKKLIKLSQNGNKIVVGVEQRCNNSNCYKPHSSSCNFFHNNSPFYLNAGFVAGIPSKLKKMLDYALIHGNGDDQVGIGKYINNNCHEFAPDLTSEIVMNLDPWAGMNDYQTFTYTPLNGFTHSTNGTKPCIIHIHGQSTDFGQRSEYIRNILFGNNHKKISYVKELFSYLSKAMATPEYKKQNYKYNIIIISYLVLSIFILIPFILFSIRRG